MKDIRRLLGSMEPFFGTEISAGLKWKYEQARAQGKILLPPPPNKAVDGSYNLGNIIWNEKTHGFFGLEEEELSQHIFIGGRTGSGKTNSSFLLLQQFIKQNKPFLIFDWKQSYRSLCKTTDIKLFTPGCNQIKPFFFNPFDIKNIPPQLQEAYYRHLLSVLLNVYFRDLKLLSVEGTEYLLLKGITYLREKKGVFTFNDLYQWAIIHDKTNLLWLHRDESIAIYSSRRPLGALVC